MRASSLCLWIIAHVIVTSLALAESAAISFAAGTSPDMDASCRIPFETLKDSKTGEFFPLSAALNENAKLPENLRRRYIVADLNSTDENGYCRGVQEHFTPVGELSEFPRLRAIAAAREVDVASLANERIEMLLASESTPGDPAGLALELEDLKNYLQQVQRYRTDPVVRPPVFKGHCVGQTLSLCEIVNGQPKLVYRFVTSSSRYAAAALPLLRAHQLHQIAELELGSQIHACRRAPRRADGRWIRRDRPLRQRRQSDRDAELPALPAHARLPGGDRERHPSDRGRPQLRRNVRGSGEPGVYPSRQVPGEARPVVDADPGEVLRAFRAEPLPHVWRRGHWQGPRVPELQDRRKLKLLQSTEEAGISHRSEPSKEQERANGQVGCAVPPFRLSRRTDHTPPGCGSASKY